VSKLYVRCHGSFDTLLTAFDLLRRDIEGQISGRGVVREFDELKLWPKSVGSKLSGTKWE
jgi:hypothetical protein